MESICKCFEGAGTWAKDQIERVITLFFVLKLLEIILNSEVVVRFVDWSYVSKNDGQGMETKYTN